MRPLQLSLRFVLFGVLVFVSFCLLSVVWAASIENGMPAAATSFSPPYDMRNSPNAVSRVMAETFGWTNDRMTSLQNIVYGAPRTAVATVEHTGKSLTAGISYVLHLPGAVVGSVRRLSVVSVIQPHAATPLPTISGFAPMDEIKPVAAALPQLPSSAPHTPSQIPAWPLHGRITTLFGVPEPPYEPIHTGIDISDGRKPGVTPIHPFESGRVIEAVRSRIKLGNHIVIDHGGGLTSVYGHLASISVSLGQSVDQSTVLGYEGSTGVSTGTHLHFEIRQNNRPVNPLQYIPGRP